LSKKFKNLDKEGLLVIDKIKQRKGFIKLGVELSDFELNK